MASRYWVGGNANWDSTVGTKWSLVSGGTGGAAVPTNADDVFLDNGAGTGNVTLASGYAAVCKSITCTGYVGTLASADATGSLSVSGAITFVAGMTLSCTNLLSALTTATLTAGGKTWGGALTLTGNAQTYTLADAWICTGVLSLGGAANSSNTINGNSITTNGGITCISTAGAVGGTTNLIMGGTGTWQNLSSNSCTISLPLELKAGAGTITVSGIVYKGTGALLYTSGTMVWTSSTLIIAATTTITLGTQTPNNLTFAGNNQTYTSCLVV